MNRIDGTFRFGSITGEYVIEEVVFFIRNNMKFYLVLYKFDGKDYHTIYTEKEFFNRIVKVA